MSFVGVNIIAVIVCAVVNMIVGSLWYSPVLFAKPWMQLVGIKFDEKPNPGPLYAVTAVAALVAAFVLAEVIALTKTAGVVGGIEVGLVVAIGFVATTTLPDYIFAGRPTKLYVINVGYQFVALIVEGAILGAWQ
jgi:hypothetical protein